MRRINLLPPEERRWRPLSSLRSRGSRGSGSSERSTSLPAPPGGVVGALAVLGAVLVVLMVGLYLVYAVRLGNVQEEISSLDNRIASRQDRVAELQPFGDLQASLDAKKPVADGIYRTRFSWDGFLEGLAFVTPDDTSLESFEGQASPVDVNAESGERLTPVGSIAFDGLALADYRNVADFVVQMNALSYLENADLENAELDRETYEEPAIVFESSSRLITRTGESGDEVPLGGGDDGANESPDENPGGDTNESPNENPSESTGGGQGGVG